MSGIDWGTVATVASTVVTAAATVALAVFTAVTLRYLRRQEDYATRERLDQYRPLVIPTSKPGVMDYTNNMIDDILAETGDATWGVYDTKVMVLNVGVGVALNVEALMLGPKDLSMSDRYTGRHPTPLPFQAAAQRIDFSRGGSMIPSQTSIAAYKLCAPDKPADAELLAGATWYVLRLTLTYRDIFRRKHASIFDYTSMGRWETVAVLDNISKDLIDLEDEQVQGQVSRLSLLP